MSHAHAGMSHAHAGMSHAHAGMSHAHAGMSHDQCGSHLYVSHAQCDSCLCMQGCVRMSTYLSLCMWYSTHLQMSHKSTT